MRDFDVMLLSKYRDVISIVHHFAFYFWLYFQTFLETNTTNCILGHIIWKALATVFDNIQMKEMKQSEKKMPTHIVVIHIIEAT